jgi:hypothetical protein
MEGRLHGRLDFLIPPRHVRVLAALTPPPALSLSLSLSLAPSPTRGHSRVSKQRSRGGSQGLSSPALEAASIVSLRGPDEAFFCFLSGARTKPTGRKVFGICFAFGRPIAPPSCPTPTATARRVATRSRRLDSTFQAFFAHFPGRCERGLGSTRDVLMTGAALLGDEPRGSALLPRTRLQSPPTLSVLFFLARSSRRSQRSPAANAEANN